ncbi:unnamed protein product [Phytomonas sp. EM1]|nr:unnamed protein product [Phytomonas sp. EM1]|eukprot:CCW62936.1 unnamed protein product [Phytomonas sp. isolate EM1]
MQRITSRSLVGLGSPVSFCQVPSLIASVTLRRFHLGCRVPRISITGVAGLALRTAQLWSSSSTKPVTPLDALDNGDNLSAVNVEDFTLNEEIVQRDLDNLSQWNLLSEAIESARSAEDYPRLLQEVRRGFDILEKLGPFNAPIQCEALLCMEAAQAHYNLDQYDDALKSAERGKESLTTNTKPDQRDMAQVGEINQFIGYILLAMGKANEAQQTFTDVLHWIDVDAKSAPPIQAVAAVNLRRVVLCGLGESYCLQAELQERDGGSIDEARRLYGKALDILIEGLNQHIDERDFELVKRTLKFILKCFEGLRDVQQAVSTCRKYISWCSRYDDNEGVLQGKKMLSDLCARHQIPNPIEQEKSRESEKS